MSETRQFSSIIPLGAALSASLVTLFFACAAVGWALPNSRGPHAWLALFTDAPFTAAGFLTGLVWNVVAAWLAAAVFVPVYNLAGKLRS
jgi:hypothetical protein